MARADVEAPGRLTATVVRGAGLTGAGYLLTLVINLASYVVLARLAGPVVFGTFAAAWIIVGVSRLFVESGMSAALIQRRDRLEEAAATAVVSTFAAGVVLTALALALSPIVGVYFEDRDIGLLAAALSGVLFINAASVVPDALLRRRFSFLARGVVDPIAALTYGAVGTATLAFGMEAWGLVIATYASGVIRAVAVWLLNRWLPRLRSVSFAMWRDLARYARHVVASAFLREISSIASIALIGRVLGVAPLGEYRLGWRLATQAAIPVASASTYVLLPAFARISDEPDRFRAAFLRSVRLFAVLVLPISLTLAVLGEQLAVAVVGEPWRRSGYVLAALAGVTATLPLTTLSNEVFKASNRPNILPRVSLLLALSALGLMVAFMPLGIVGVAGGISIAYALTAAYALWNVARVLALPVRAILAELWKPALAAAALAGAVALFAAFVARVDDDPTLVRLSWLAVEIVLGLLVYFAVLLKVARSTVAELMGALRSLVPGAHRRERVTAAGVAPVKTPDHS